MSSPLPTTPATDEQAFALALATEGAAGPGADDLWRCLAPGLRTRLGAAVVDLGGLDADDARKRLRQWYGSESRVVLARVHPTWLVRALRDESPAVIRAVAANVSGQVQSLICREFGLVRFDLTPRTEPESQALWHALTLWTERLVGGGLRPDDQPVVKAMMSLRLRSLYRLAHQVGVYKRAWVAHAADASLPPPFKVDASALIDRRYMGIARRDLERVARIVRGRRGRPETWLGLQTAARLLSVAEPIRVRRAFQVLPYPLAKVIRSGMAGGSVAAPELWLGGEQALFQAASRHLAARGPAALSPDWGTFL